jgi:Ca2+-binding RTX toxin-like protein
MDVGTTERIDVRALGGDDATTINDLSGTDVIDVIVDGGSGNDTFVGSSLRETFLGGDGDDTATVGDGDFFDMGAGIDTLVFFGTAGRDNIHVDARTIAGHDVALFHDAFGDLQAVFDNGEVISVITQAADDKVKVHRRAANLWDVQIVE